MISVHPLKITFTKILVELKMFNDFLI